ncbi:MAG: precorrin-6y C5,15-methyltransferase (decarboxylating) subunit CbiE, partial [Microcystaceae cyanobacterium]
MIEVVGIGLDGAAGLTESVRQFVENATLLVGSDRHLSYFPNHPAQRIILGDLIEAITEIRHRLTSEKQIVILVSGDPLFFGLGRLLLEKFPSEQLRFYPHLSSVQLAFNRIKVPWQDARIVSVHGRSLDELTQLLQQGIEKIAILTDGSNTPNAIAHLYLSLELPTPYEFWICENLEATQEQIYHFSTGDTTAFNALMKQDFSPLNVVILLRQNQSFEQFLDVNKLPILGLSDKTFSSFSDRPGLMTKREIRLLVLGELSLQPGQIIWDIGAGTGSVAIEIARLCPTSV